MPRKSILAAGALALAIGGALVAPAAADAPPLDTQVGELRSAVSELQTIVAEQQADLDRLAGLEDRAAGLAQTVDRLRRTPAVNCIADAEAVRFTRIRLADGRQLAVLVDVADGRRIRGKKWLALVSASCMPAPPPRVRRGPDKEGPR
jgi:hypothetical protein